MTANILKLFGQGPTSRLQPSAPTGSKSPASKPAPSYLLAPQPEPTYPTSSAQLSPASLRAKNPAITGLTTRNHAGQSAVTPEPAAAGTSAHLATHRYQNY